MDNLTILPEMFVCVFLYHVLNFFMPCNTNNNETQLLHDVVSFFNQACKIVKV